MAKRSLLSRCPSYVNHNLKIIYRYHSELQNNISHITYRYTCVYDLSGYYMLLGQQQLVAGVRPRRPRFYPRPVYVR